MDILTDQKLPNSPVRLTKHYDCIYQCVFIVPMVRVTLKFVIRTSCTGGEDRLVDCDKLPLLQILPSRFC